MKNIITRFTERFSAHNMSGGRPVAVNCADRVRLCGRFEVESHDEIEAKITGIKSTQSAFYSYQYFKIHIQSHAAFSDWSHPSKLHLEMKSQTQRPRMQKCKSGTTWSRATQIRALFFIPDPMVIMQNNTISEVGPRQVRSNTGPASPRCVPEMHRDRTPSPSPLLQVHYQVKVPRI